MYLTNALHTKDFPTTKCYRDVRSLDNALEILNMVAKTDTISKAYYSGKLVDSTLYWNGKGGTLIDTFNNQGKLIIS